MPRMESWESSGRGSTRQQYRWVVVFEAGVGVVWVVYLVGTSHISFDFSMSFRSYPGEELWHGVH